MRLGRKVQYAALPYRVRQDGTVQIRLITSRETRRWVIPKGWPMKGLSPSKAAAREAYEEAGLLGSMSRKPVGMYSYEKRLSVRSVPCDVMVFPLKVKRKLQDWPERSERVGFWFTIESAAFAVNEDELKALILDFGDLMARKWEEKKKPKAKGKLKEPADASVEKGTEEAEAVHILVPTAKARAKRKAASAIDDDVKLEKKKVGLGLSKADASGISGDVQAAGDCGPKEKSKSLKAKTSEKSSKPGSKAGK